MSKGAKGESKVESATAHRKRRTLNSESFREQAVQHPTSNAKGLLFDSRFGVRR